MITRGLKELAGELDIANILLHQLSRDLERRGGDKRPKLHDLRDSGNVEQDAQQVIMLYRPEYYKIAEAEYGSTAGVIEALVVKNSNGDTDTAMLKFHPLTASITDQGVEFAQDKPHPDNRTESLKDPPF